MKNINFYKYLIFKKNLEINLRIKESVFLCSSLVFLILNSLVYIQVKILPQFKEILFSDYKSINMILVEKTSLFVTNNYIALTSILAILTFMAISNIDNFTNIKKAGDK